MSAELISVIIPVYNHASILRASLLSLLKQTHDNLEVIVVNDGSTDNFASVFSKIQNDERFARLRLRLINEENRGAAAARNAGAEAAIGEYVIFWDADTIAKPQMLRKMLTALKQNQNSSYAYSGFRFGWKNFPSRSFDAAALRANNFIDTTSLIRAADLEKFDENLKRFQDWDLWLSMLEQNKTGVFVPEILYEKKQQFFRGGISRWLPSFVYRLPFKIKAVHQFEEARAVVLAKHGSKPTETRVA